MKKIIAILVGYCVVCFSGESLDCCKLSAELCEMMFPRERVVDSYTALFDSQFRDLKEKGIDHADIEGLCSAFIEKVVSDPEYTEGMAAIYEKVFSVQEMQEMLEFFRTPAGAKAMEKLPELFQRGAMIEQEVRIKYLPQLNKDIQAIRGKGKGSVL